MVQGIRAIRTLTASALRVRRTVTTNCTVTTKSEGNQIFEAIPNINLYNKNHHSHLLPLLNHLISYSSV